MGKKKLKPYTGNLHPRSSWKGKNLPPDLKDQAEEPDEELEEEEEEELEEEEEEVEEQ